uniref:AB hydrolase-1 domain-containing protein n=1 Tax=Attheya septentrionalis TaxID=420275 RepID=A0A7S2XLX0_9STRA|mmetsp:Transcript_20544/g.37187  ORF Transcript_20544/g.37187 Transcript_20544/m.37187 type:complete len:370 (+) Transcript_20544:21-1130(+)
MAFSLFPARRIACTPIAHLVAKYSQRSHQSSILRRSKNDNRVHFISTTRVLGKEPMVLHHEWISNGQVVPSQSDDEKKSVVVMLHGLLGNGKNLRTPAKVLTKENDNLSALLLDLRGHGNSNPTSSEHSDFQLLARDVLHTLDSLGLHSNQSPISWIGHSLGGRVALQSLHHLIDKKQEESTAGRMVQLPKTVWIWDSVPGLVHEDVKQVVGALESVPMPFLGKRKADLVNVLVNEKGLSKPIAQWAASSLEPTENGFVFSFDLKVARNLLDNFHEQNYMEILHGARQHHSESVKNNSGTITSKIHIVMADRNPSWTPEILQQLKSIHHDDDETPFLGLHTLPKAGHWVHVDNLSGLVQIMQDHGIDKH